MYHSSIPGFQKPPRVTHVYEPLEDITTYELAQLLPTLMRYVAERERYGVTGPVVLEELQSKQVEKLSENVRRHFRRVEEPG